MKRVGLLSLLICAFSFSSMSLLKSNSLFAEERDATIIVKMKTDVNIYSHSFIINQQNYLLDQIRNNITPNYKIQSRYSTLFSGFVINVPSSYVEDIRQLELVDEIDYNNYFCYEESFDDGSDYEIYGTPSSASNQTMEKPDGTNDGAGTFVAILDNGFYIRTTFGRQSYHHVFSSLDKADAYITQSSLKAKIDAASSFHGKYDRSHTTYYNNKVPFYYDYGGDKANSVTPDYDVYAEGESHGSHVASIAAGNAGEEYEGVAPRAQLALMKVFTTYLNGNTYVSGAYPAAVLNALEDCLVLEVDAINMSFGTNLNDFDDTEIIQGVIKELNNRGTFINVAAGNDGKGEWNGTAYCYWQSDMVESGILSSYANNLSTMTVASGQPDSQFYGVALTIDGHNVHFSDQVTNYSSSSGDVQYDPERHFVDLLTTYQTDEFSFVYLPGLGKEEEYDGIDVNGKILITNRGEITFKEKVINATQRGAIAVGIIDNTADTEFNIRMAFASDEGVYTPPVPVIFLLNRDKEVFENSTSSKIKIIQNTDLDNPNARTMSEFSSDGMRYDLSIKPEITAPGSNIKGAILGAVNKYESMSGTSMAAPNYTGAVSLLMGEHLNDNEYRSTINARLMSTAQPMLENSATTIHSSVRRQGAGMINLSGALTSPVYLDGLNDKGEQIGKAKIELFNNEDIAKGNINLSFAAINESEESISYEAKTYVYAPKLEEADESVYPELAHKKLQTISEQLVEVYTDEINTVSGINKINISHSLSEESLQRLNEDFETGCVLEGFVILKAVDKPQLSIPFLGFYGDLKTVSPVEPFDFEKDENKAYHSDLINAYAVHNRNIDPIDFGSHILSGYWSDCSNTSLENVFKKNTTNISETLDEKENTLKVLGLNPYGKYDSHKIYVSNNDDSNTLVIQQCVLRSVMNNTVKLVDKKTGEELIVSHLTDSLNGGTSLYKSHLDLSTVAIGYIAHRAYCILPLYKDIDGTKEYFEDGEYELIFSYELCAGSTYEKKVEIVIDNSSPKLQSIEKVTIADADYFKFNYQSTNLAVVSFGENKYEAHLEDDSSYALIPIFDLINGTFTQISATNYVNNNENYLLGIEENTFVLVANENITNDDCLSYEVIGRNTNDQYFDFYLSNGKELVGTCVYYLLLPNGLDIDSLIIYALNDDGEETPIDFTHDNGLISFVSDCHYFNFVSKALDTPIDNPEEPASPINSSSEPVISSSIESSKPEVSSEEVSSQIEESSKQEPIGSETNSVPSPSPSSSSNVTSTTTPASSSSEQKTTKKGCGGSLYENIPLVFIALTCVTVFLFKRKKEIN